MLVALSKRINAPEGGYRNQTAAMRPQWVNYFDARVATTIIRCMDAACPVSALAHSLSIDPLVSRDEFFSHVFGEVESPPEVRKGNCFRLQLVPSLIQKTVVSVLQKVWEKLPAKICRLCAARFEESESLHPTKQWRLLPLENKARTSTRDDDDDDHPHGHLFQDALASSRGAEVEEERGGRAGSSAQQRLEQARRSFTASIVSSRVALGYGEPLSMAWARAQRTERTQRQSAARELAAASSARLRAEDDEDGREVKRPRREEARGGGDAEEDREHVRQSKESSVQRPTNAKGEQQGSGAIVGTRRDRSEGSEESERGGGSEAIQSEMGGGVRKGVQAQEEKEEEQAQEKEEEQEQEEEKQTRSTGAEGQQAEAEAEAGAGAGARAAGGAGAGAAGGLREEDERKLERLAGQLRGLRTQAVGGAQHCPSELRLVLEMHPLDAALQRLGLADLSDEGVLLVRAELCAAHASHHAAAAFMRVALLPRLLALSAPASRALLSAVTAAAKEHARAALHALLSPLLTHPSLGSAQVEVINRVVKDSLPPSSHPALLDLLCGGHAGAAGHVGAAGGHVEGVLGHVEVAVLHVLLTLKPALSPAQLEQIVQALRSTVEGEEEAAGPASAMASDLKFSNLVLGFVSKYGKELSGSAGALRLVGERITTSLRRPIATMLARITPPA